MQGENRRNKTCTKQLVIIIIKEETKIKIEKNQNKHENTHLKTHTCSLLQSCLPIYYTWTFLHDLRWLHLRPILPAGQFCIHSPVT